MFTEKLGDEQRLASEQAVADAKLADMEGQVRQVILMIQRDKSDRFCCPFLVPSWYKLSP